MIIRVIEDGGGFRFEFRDDEQLVASSRAYPSAEEARRRVVEFQAIAPTAEVVDLT
jgi:uncharacterized protein YegP (UPF0339 family)